MLHMTLIFSLYIYIARYFLSPSLLICCSSSFFFSSSSRWFSFSTVLIATSINKKLQIYCREDNQVIRENKMHADAELQLPPAFSQGFLQELASSSLPGHYSNLSEESLISFNASITDGGFNLANLVQPPTISEYDMGGEGDLFKAPEPILEVPELELDPVAAAMSIISSGITETINVADIASIQNDRLNNILFECKKGILEESEVEDSISELLDVRIPAVQNLQMDEVFPTLERLCSAEGSIQKSVSFECLDSPNSTMRPDFIDIQGLDLAAAFGLRRAYSESDIQNLGNKNTSTGSAVAVCSSFEQLLAISDLKTEQRLQKLSRYRDKKSKRNFGRKIKYACRKALADSQPRVRGRFAKTEESEVPKSNRLKKTLT